MSRKKKKKHKLRRRPRPKGVVIVDGVRVGTNLKEKQVLYYCLVDLIWQLRFMHPEAIRRWLLDVVTFSYRRQLSHYRIKRILHFISTAESYEKLVRIACELILSSEGYSTLPNFYYKLLKRRVNAEKVTLYELRNVYREF